jgi:hypothetical protein
VQWIGGTQDEESEIPAQRPELSLN